MNKNIRCGAVVIGRNEGQRLIKCLESLVCQLDYIVYVDSGSTDNSLIEAEKLGVSCVLLDLSLPFTAARARNAGAEYLGRKYNNLEYYHFIDGDCELSVTWLDNAIKVFEEKKGVAIVCGRLREKHRNSSVYMRLCDMDWYRSAGFVDSCGGIATYKRASFEAVKGFDSQLMAGEEPELCKRIRENSELILCINSEMGTHDSGMTRFSQWWTRCVKVGFGFMSGSEWGGWSKQYKSAIFWGLGVPLILVVSAFFTSGLSLLGFALYPVQVYRIFRNVQGEGLAWYDKFIYSFFCVLSKFPEAQGVIAFYINKIKKKNTLIQYK